VKNSILLTLFLLTGCALNPATDDKLIIPAAAEITTERCMSIPFPKNPMDMGDLMVYNTELMILYTECAMRHDALVNEAGGKIKLSK
jgi:hypothetical protein